MFGINAKDLAARCGANVLRSATRVDDRMLLDARSAASLEEYVIHSLVRELAATIVSSAPKGEFEIQRVVDKHCPPGLYPGATEYRMGVVVFSERGFEEFVEKLLNTYGDQYAQAAMDTKKKRLKKNIEAAIERA